MKSEVAENDARLIIEKKMRDRQKKKRKIQDADIEVEEDTTTARERPEEEGAPGFSEISHRNQATEEDERNALRNLKQKAISLEREVSDTPRANRELQAGQVVKRENAQSQPIVDATARLQSERDHAWNERNQAFNERDQAWNERNQALNELDNAWPRCECSRMPYGVLMQRYQELEKMKNEADIAFQDEKMKSALHIDYERRRLRQYIVEMQQKERESLECLQADKLNLESQLDEQRWKADAQIQSLTISKTRLQDELHAPRIAIQTGKSDDEKKLATALVEKENAIIKLALVEGERVATSATLFQQKAQVKKIEAELAASLRTKENLQKRLVLVEGERDATKLEMVQQKAELDRQKTLVIQERDDKLKVEKALIGQNRKLDSDVVRIRKEAEQDTRKLVKDHQNDLDEARTEILNLKSVLEYVREEKNRWEQLGYDVSLIQKEAAEDKRQLVSAQTHISHLKRCLKENHRLEKLEKGLGLIKEEAAESDRVLRQAHADIFQLNEFCKEDENQLERLEYDVNLLREKATEDKKLVQARKNELDEARSDLVHQKMELQLVREEKKGVESAFNLIQVEAAQNKRKLAQAHNELDEARKNIEHLKMQLEALREEKKRLENDLSFTQEGAHEEKRKLMQVQKTKLAEAKKKKLHLKMELDCFRREKKRLENDLKKSEEEKRKHLQAHKIEMDEARTNTAELRRELDSSWEERNRLAKLEYDVGRIEDGAAEDKTKLVNARRELKAARADILSLEREIESLREEKRRLGKVGYEAKSFRQERKRLESLKYEFSRIHEETAEDETQIVQQGTCELDEARTHIAHLELELECSTEEKDELDSVHEGVVRNLGEAKAHIIHLKSEIQSFTEQKSLQHHAHEKVLRSLEEEKERSLCQICLDSPKDTISFPCLHLQYCFSCLEKHRKQSNTCPSCRTTIHGVTCLSLLS